MYKIWYTKHQKKRPKYKIESEIHFTREDSMNVHVTQSTTPHYKWRRKKKGLRRYHSNSEVFDK